jgi:trimethylamine--corrinoid protein Co-methyltransferase
VLHAAGWLKAGLVMSYEKFVMDQDQLGALHTLARGISLDDNGFALEAFREIGPGRHYLGSAHTLANYQSAFYDFELAYNNSFEQWGAEGGRDQLQRANRRSKGLLEAYERPPLDAAREEALLEYVTRRKRSMPDELG